MNEINGQEIKEFLQSTGQSLAYHSEQAGFAKSYFKNSLRKNRLSDEAMAYLTAIGYKSDKKDSSKNKKKKIPDDTKVANLTVKELKNIIYNVVCVAIRRKLF